MQSAHLFRKPMALVVEREPDRRHSVYRDAVGAVALDDDGDPSDPSGRQAPHLRRSDDRDRDHRRERTRVGDRERAAAHVVGAERT